MSRLSRFRLPAFSLAVACSIVLLPAAVGSARAQAGAKPVRKSVAAAPAQQFTGPNAEVVDLVRAGVKEPTLLNFVKAHEGKFDVAARDILALAKAGVPESVIDAMMAKSARPAPASDVSALVPSPGRAPTTGVAGEAPAVPPGVYCAGRSDSNGNPSPIDPTPYVAKTSGFVTKTATAWLEGENAGVVVTDAQPEFQFRFAAAGTPSDFPGSGPEEFTLARFKVKDGKRSIQIGKVSIGTLKAGIDEDDVIPVDREKISPGVFSVRPRAPLKPGQYCFFRVPANPLDVAAGVGGRLWAFGIAEDGGSPAK
jgi:hypothetical protein